jgi:hypothetical protein
MEAPAPDYKDPRLIYWCPLCHRNTDAETSERLTELPFFGSITQEEKYCDSCVMEAKDCVEEGYEPDIQTALYNTYPANFKGKKLFYRNKESFGFELFKCLKPPTEAELFEILKDRL